MEYSASALRISRSDMERMIMPEDKFVRVSLLHISLPGVVKV